MSWTELEKAITRQIAELTEERDELEHRLSSLLCHVTNNRFSKTGYSAEQMQRFADDCRMEECEKCEDIKALKEEKASDKRALIAAGNLLKRYIRERDAAIEDMKHAASPTGNFCEICKHYGKHHGDKPCYGETVTGNCFEWRGVQR